MVKVGMQRPSFLLSVLLFFLCSCSTVIEKKTDEQLHAVSMLWQKIKQESDRLQQKKRQLAQGDSVTLQQLVAWFEQRCLANTPASHAISNLAQQQCINALSLFKLYNHEYFLLLDSDKHASYLKLIYWIHAAELYQFSQADRKDLLKAVHYLFKALTYHRQTETELAPYLQQFLLAQIEMQLLRLLETEPTLLLVSAIDLEYLISRKSYWRQRAKDSYILAYWWQFNFGLHKELKTWLAKEEQVLLAVINDGDKSQIDRAFAALTDSQQSALPYYVWPVLQQENIETSRHSVLAQLYLAQYHPNVRHQLTQTQQQFYFLHYLNVISNNDLQNKQEARKRCLQSKAFYVGCMPTQNAKVVALQQYEGVKQQLLMQFPLELLTAQFLRKQGMGEVLTSKWSDQLLVQQQQLKEQIMAQLQPKQFSLQQLKLLMAFYAKLNLSDGFINAVDRQKVEYYFYTKQGHQLKARFSSFINTELITWLNQSQWSLDSGND